MVYFLRATFSFDLIEAFDVVAEVAEVEHCEWIEREFILWGFILEPYVSRFNTDKVQQEQTILKLLCQPHRMMILRTH